MLITIAMAGALLAATPADDAVCKVIGETAEAVMAARQRGVVMSEMMAGVEQGGYEELFRGLIIAAYDSPQFGTDEARARVAREFRNKAELQCFQALPGAGDS